MTRMEQGLSEAEAGRRLAENGRNELKKQKEKGRLSIFLEQLLDPLIYVLLVAAFVSVLLKEYSDAVIIVVVILLNAFVGMIQEGRAKKALAALEKLQSPMAMVIRDGRKREIPAGELVVGDLVCLETGCRVPADILLTEAVELQVEESALTGESVPVEKTATRMLTNKELINKALNSRDGAGNIEQVYMSTTVVSGRGMGIVLRTGMDTELGRIADMIHEEKEELTPLQKRLGDLGIVLSMLSLMLCGGLFAIAVLQKRNVFEMLITAISLAVAAVPEGLPAVVTICLALSVTRMVKANTIIRRLPCVETLGSVSVVCSDKTGTLTMGHMTVEKGYWNGKLRDLAREQDAPDTELLRGICLCNDAVLAGRDLQRQTEAIGDPTEIALMELANRYGIMRDEEERKLRRISEVPFSSERKEMITYHREGGVKIAYCKGAPDIVLEKCTDILVRGNRKPLPESERKRIRNAVQELSGQAYRLLAVAAYREGWIFLGLVALRDPVRPKAKESVQTLKNAGVSTVMITGDHALTAMAIARTLGIAGEECQCIQGQRLDALSEEELDREISARNLRVFARVTPAQKVRIVKAFQRRGGIVAMTGDGVNDAPSLKAADIGIAMGKNGTDVAKQAADLVLTDDRFSTIERAIEEGRGVYENIRKSVIFLLSSNLGELLTMFVSVMLGMAAPLKSAHILWINLITDSLPALALGVDQNNGAELMKNPPRKAQENLFARGGLGCTCFYGILIAGISLAAFLIPVLPLITDANGITDMLVMLRAELGNAQNLTKAQTYAFTVLGMSQLFHAIGMRDVSTSVFFMRQGRNPLMYVAFLVGFGLQLAVTEIPMLVQAFGTSHLSLAEWGRLTALSAVPLIAHELIAIMTFVRDHAVSDSTNHR